MCTYDLPPLSNRLDLIRVIVTLTFRASVLEGCMPVFYLVLRELSTANKQKGLFLMVFLSEKNNLKKVGKNQLEKIRKKKTNFIKLIVANCFSCCFVDGNSTI